MSASPACLRCGYQNQPGYQYCTNCGASLTGGPGTPPPPAGYPPAVAYPGVPYPGSYDYGRARGIDRTKTGVLLLFLGTLMSWIPVVQVFGYFLILVGVILVILGRKAFGSGHARNVVVSIILFVVGIVVVFAVVVVAALLSSSGSIGPGGAVAPTPALLGATLNGALLAGIAAAIVIGLAELLFTYGLQAQTGRILLWAAYGANLALNVAIYLLLSPFVSRVATFADYDAVAAMQGTYALLGVIPALLFAAADYLAWSRINKGELPGRSSAPPGYPSAPPLGPAPPINPK